MPSASLAIGTRFGPYTILRLLGEGGMGSVYEARHERLAKRVALKVLHADVVATNEEAVARFTREGEVASQIRHPNVVDVTDVGREDGVPYMVMEYLEGETLGALLETRRALEVSEAIDLLLPIASALAAAHEEQIVHRDLKPDNIFLARTRVGEVVPKLVDFGISKFEREHDPKLTAVGAMMGTPQYMSPEQARGSRDVDGRTDQYAFGVILHECLTGETAVRGDSLLEILHEINSGRIARVDALRPGVPSGLVDAVARMHARDPADRFPDMVAVGAELLPFASPRARAVWGARFVAGEAAPASTSHGTGAVERTPTNQTFWQLPAGNHANVTAAAEGTPAPTMGTAPSSSPESAPRPPRFVALALGVVVGLGALAAAIGFRAGTAAPAPTESPGPFPAVAAPSAPAVVRVDETEPAAPVPSGIAAPDPSAPADAPQTEPDAGTRPAGDPVALAAGSASPEPTDVPDAGAPASPEAEGLPAVERPSGPRRGPGRRHVRQGANRSIILR